MAGIVYSGLQDESFSFRRFYLARAIRIIPALVFVVLAVVISGWFFMSSLRYEELANHAIYAVLFWSNVKFWREAGYFDVESHEKLLLHTWSLSVEWQFYLIFPVVLVLLYRLVSGWAGIFLSLLIAFLAGVYLSQSLAVNDPVAAFYGLHSRFWEMLSGALIYFLSIRLSLGNFSRRMLLCGGLVALFSSMLIFKGDSTWPGVNALLVVAAVSGILLSNSLGRIPVFHSPVNWLGLRSYSIYLWHWPFAACLTYFDENNIWFLIGALFSTLVISEFTYRFVEIGARNYINRLSIYSALTSMGIGVVICTLVFVAIKESGGASFRLPAAALTVEAEAGNSGIRRKSCLGGSDVKEPYCIFGGSDIKAIVIGDSHAMSVVTAVESALEGGSSGVLIMAHSSCPTIRGISKLKEGHGCSYFNGWALDKLETFGDAIPVIVINRSSTYIYGPDARSFSFSPAIRILNSKSYIDEAVFLEELKGRMIQTYCDIARRRPVYLVRPIPEMPSSAPDFMSRQIIVGKESRLSISHEEYLKRHDFIIGVQNSAVEACGVKVLDPTDFLCRDGECFADNKGHPIYYDDNHLSESGNKLLVSMFRKVFD